jgi:hypothetical protein
MMGKEIEDAQIEIGERRRVFGGGRGSAQGQRTSGPVVMASPPPSRAAM